MLWLHLNSLYLTANLHSENWAPALLRKSLERVTDTLFFPVDSHPNSSGGQNYFSATSTEERKYHGQNRLWKIISSYRTPFQNYLCQTDSPALWTKSPVAYQHLLALCKTAEYVPSSMKQHNSALHSIHPHTAFQNYSSTQRAHLFLTFRYQCGLFKAVCRAVLGAAFRCPRRTVAALKYTISCRVLLSAGTRYFLEKQEVQGEWGRHKLQLKGNSTSLLQSD